MTLHRNWRLWLNTSSKLTVSQSSAWNSWIEEIKRRGFWPKIFLITWARNPCKMNQSNRLVHSFLFCKKNAPEVLEHEWIYLLQFAICILSFHVFFLLSNNEVENIVLATFVDCHSGSVQFDSDTSRVVDGSTLQIQICILTLVTIQNCRRPLPYFFPLLLNKSITEKCSSQSIILPLSRSISMLSSLHAQVGSPTQIANNQLQDLWTKFIFSASNGRTAQLFPHQVAIATSCLLLQLCQSSPAIDLPM